MFSSESYTAPALSSAFASPRNSPSIRPFPPPHLPTMPNETVVRLIERRRKYMWPEAQLNFWLIIMIASGATILGIFAYFMTVQSQFHLGVPWYVLSLLRFFTFSR